MKIPAKYLLKYFNENFDSFELHYNRLHSLILKQKQIDYKNKRVLAIYDFSNLPYTFDIVAFLLNAEIERRHYNLEKIDIVFITDSTYPADMKYQPNIDTQHSKNILHNIGLEIVRLFENIGSTFIFDNRNQIIDFYKAFSSNYHTIYPLDYNPNLPFERIPNRDIYSYLITNYTDFAKKDPTLNAIQSPILQQELATKWLNSKIKKDQIAITITLREWKEVSAERSSNIEEWQKVITYFEQYTKFIFIILRDYYNLYDDDNLSGKNVIYCNEAVLSLSFRTALYEQTALNLFVTNGIGTVLWHNQNTNYIEFKHIIGTGSTSLNHNKKYLKLDFGHKWHGATKYQKIIWNNETFDTIKDEINTMISILEMDNRLHKKRKGNIENIIDKKIYQRKSLMSERLPLKSYIISYKIFKIYRYLKNTLSPLFKAYMHLENICYPLKNINKIVIDKNTKIIVYGAGTITEKLIPNFKSNIIGILDKNYPHLSKDELDGIKIYPLSEIENISFDYILITPVKREYHIRKELIKLYSIKKNKFLIWNNQKN